MLPHDSTVVTDLLNEKNLSAHTLIEDYLTVALNIRKCSLMTIPAELPDSNMISKRIDEKCAPEFNQLTRERDVKKKLRMIKSFKESLRKAYLEETGASSSYKSHTTWIKQLGLEVFEVEIRPTVREDFILKYKETKSQIEALTRKRLRFREEFLRHADPTTPKPLLAYPEERFPEYLIEVGKLLEYSPCCISAYVEDRSEGRTSAEQRAATQVEDFKAHGTEPDIYTYFSKDFIPCSPTCTSAAAIGQKINQAMKEIDNRLSEIHIQCLKNNVKRVSSYVEIIQAHRTKMEVRSRELGAY
jgi:hypothetical protein